MRAAIATGQSIPGAISPSTPSASASRSMPSLVLRRDERPPVGVGEAHGSRVPVGGHDESPRSRAAARRPSCAGPAPRTRRRFGASPRPPPPGLVLAIPADRPLEPLVEARARPPARQPRRLLGRADVPVDLAEPFGHVRLAAARGLPSASSTGRRSRTTEMSIPVATFSTSPATRSIGVSMIASIASASSST